MSRLFVLFLLLVSCGYAQQKEKLDVRIHSLGRTASSQGGYDFSIEYHIVNRTADTLSFFLENQLQPNASSSLSNKPFYRIYQNNTMIDIWGIFEPWIRPDAETNVNARMIFRDTMTPGYWTRERYEEIKRREVRGSIQKLGPGRTLSITWRLHWDGMRYFRHDELEYYLDENLPHSIEICLNLLREEHAKYFTDEEFKAIQNDPNFIRGWYASEKVPLDFSP